MAHDECHDGTRPVRAGDGPAIEAMHARCSAVTLRSRWHGVSRRVPRAYLAEVLAGEPWHVGVVATGPGPGEVVGLASARDGGDHWEIAVVVEDAAQGNGLGRALLTATIEAVRGAGGTRVEADVLADNRVPVHLVSSFGATVVSRHREQVRVSVDLASRPTRRSMSARTVVGVDH